MSDARNEPEQPEPKRTEPHEPEPSQGPSLTLLYSLIALALVAAIGFALMIVMPFHQRH
jgi:hypothetical protein